MRKERGTSSRRRNDADERTTYSAPRLIQYGSLKHLTAGGPRGFGDPGNLSRFALFEGDDPTV